MQQTLSAQFQQIFFKSTNQQHLLVHAAQFLRRNRFPIRRRLLNSDPGHG